MAKSISCAGVLVATVALLAFLLNLNQEENQAFVKSLQPIRRIRSQELSQKDFLAQHVLPAVPVIIDVASPGLERGRTNLTDGFWHDEPVLKACGSKQVTALSRATRTVLMGLDDGTTPPILKTLLSLFLKLTAGTSLEEYVAVRDKITLRAFWDWMARHEANSAAAARKVKRSLWLLSLAARFSQSAAGIYALARVVLGPPYLFDVSTSSVCSQLERKGPEGPLNTAWTAYERQAKYTSTDWLREVFGQKDTDPKDPSNFFWGGTGSFAYPLHKDIIDADNFLQVLSGCKEVVFLWEHHFSDVDNSKIPGTSAFAFDVFDAPAPESVSAGAKRAGWHGIAYAGELIFMPGNGLHHVRNMCPSTVGVNVRPWHHSAARQVAQHSGVPVP